MKMSSNTPRTVLCVVEGVVQLEVVHVERGRVEGSDQHVVVQVKAVDRDRSFHLVTTDAKTNVGNGEHDGAGAEAVYRSLSLRKEASFRGPPTAMIVKYYRVITAGFL